MNRDADATSNSPEEFSQSSIQELWNWLFPNPTPDDFNVPSGEGTGDLLGSDGSGDSDRNVNSRNRPNADTQNVMLTNLSQPNLSSTQSSIGDTVSFEFGEMSAVQDRFYALLKRRLRDEIERNPPLFPWENDLCDYEPEVLDWEPAQLVPVSIWLKQIQERLPVPMSDQLLAVLFSRCQDVVHGSLQQGAKLVQAVEDLFPGQEQTLNYLARLVLTPSFRDGSDRLQTEGFPTHYNVATTEQQMALSLIAVSEILESLTLHVSATSPDATRQWTTSTGTIQVSVQYQHQEQQASRLRVESSIPCPGHLKLQGMSGETMTHRDDAGCISVELFDVEPNQTYRLTVQLEDGAKSPLVFSIQVDE
ncbi:MAG: PatU [Cyanobacteria bacterium P01_F01_bin.150]